MTDWWHKANPFDPDTQRDQGLVWENAYTSYWDNAHEADSLAGWAGELSEAQLDGAAVEWANDVTFIDG